MDEVEIFLKHHRAKLLRYLDGEAPGSLAEPGPLEYVDQVLEEWSGRFVGRTLGEPSRGERTFWFALYELEELAGSSGGPVHPYEGVMMERLAEVRELLRTGAGLPPGFFATRPGEAFGDAL